MSQDKIKISIITATYNASNSLGRLINSVAQQKADCIEFIIIDGNSKDKTLDIIQQNESFVDYWISESDTGVYDAWNKGVQVARGEWIMFLGADDVLLPNGIGKYLDLLVKVDLSNYDYISARNRYVDEKGRRLKNLGQKADWKFMRKGMSAAHVGSLHNKKNLFLADGLYNLDFKICADYELLLRKKQYLNSYFMDEVVAEMNVGGMSFSVKAIYETYLIRKKHHAVLEIYNYFLFIRDVLGYQFFRLRNFV